jgi:hypothetical protein
MTRFPSRPSQRAIKRQLAALDTMANGATLVIEPPAPQRQQKPRAQREAGVSDAIKDWRYARGDVRLWRNNTGAYPLPGGGWLRYGLCPGSADFVGLHSVVITPGMVGKRVAVFFALETKAPKGVLEPHQERWLNEIKDAGGIAGVARSAEEAEAALARWREGVTRDER